jgi:hypothetical protein
MGPGAGVSAALEAALSPFAAPIGSSERLANAPLSIGARV